MKSKLLSLLISLGLLLVQTAALPQTFLTQQTVYAQGVQTDGYEYELLSDGTIRLTQFVVSGDHAQIPQELDGLKVTSLAKGLFAQSSGLLSVYVPDTVTDIGTWSLGYSLKNGTYQKISGFKIYCSKGSAAQSYAKSSGLDYALADQQPERVFGSDRYETAFGIADSLRAANCGKKFDNIIIASGSDFPDALSAAYLAKVKEAPILLTSISVTDKVAQYIRSNANADATVYIIGGTAAVSSKTESSLKGFKTIRLAGPNRYITNLLVLAESGVSDQEILIASGTGYADALSASAVGKPILLAANTGFTGDQKSYLSTLKSSTATIIGGTGAVSNTVQTQAKSYFSSVSRVGGSDRYETSANVAAKYFPKATALTLAYGLNYPDGLCGGTLAMRYSSPLVLAASNSFYNAKAYAAKAGSVSATALGGTALISDEAVRAILSTSISGSYTSGKITLNWKSVYGAASYNVYNVTSGKTFMGNSSSCTFSIGCKSATTYKFQVVALDASGKAINGQDMFIIIGSDPAAVSGLKAGTVTSSSAELIWTNIEHSYYEIYRKSTGSFTLIATTGANRFVDTTVTGGAAYEYKVRAVYVDSSGIKHYGGYSSAIKLSTVPSMPIFTECTSDVNYITLRWNKVNGVNKYYVSILKDGKWTTYTTANNYYTFSGLTRSTSYQFSVYGVKTDSMGTYRSNTASCTLATDSTVKSKTSFTIYASPSESSQKLYTGGSGVVLDKKGAAANGWHKVYIPGSKKQKFGYVKASQVAGYVDLNFSPIYQLGWSGGAPLPTGCETTALATLLACHLKLPCTKNLLADKFLTIVQSRVGDPNYASWGSPYDETAYGVMAPALAETANRFLKSIGVRDQYQIDVHTDNDANMSWHKLDTGPINHTSGLDLAGLKSELEKGHAVQIWWTTRGADPDSYAHFTINRGERYTHDGTGTYDFTWVGTQHGSVISGYDETTGEFIIADVGWGFTVRHSFTHFMKLYTAQSRQSIVIYKK